MKETTMSSWQITQLFLSDSGPQEVWINIDNKKLRCTCEGFNTRSMCKHTRFVSERMNNNAGVYPVEISSKAPEQAAAIASLDPIMFRDFLLKYGKIEVL